MIRETESVLIRTHGPVPRRPRRKGMYRGKGAGRARVLRARASKPLPVTEAEARALDRRRSFTLADVALEGAEP